MLIVDLLVIVYVYFELVVVVLVVCCCLLVAFGSVCLLIDCFVGVFWLDCLWVLVCCVS